MVGWFLVAVLLAVWLPVLLELAVSRFRHEWKRRCA